MFVKMPWQPVYVNASSYTNIIEHKCSLTPLDPRLLYIGPIQLRDTCPLGTPVQIHKATCLYYVYYVKLYIVMQDTYLYYAVLGTF